MNLLRLFENTFYNWEKHNVKVVCPLGNDNYFYDHLDEKGYIPTCCINNEILIRVGTEQQKEKILKETYKKTIGDCYLKGSSTSIACLNMIGMILKIQN